MAANDSDSFRTTKTHTTVTTTIHEHAAPKSLIITRSSGLYGSPSSSVTKSRTFTTRSGVDPVPEFTAGDYALKTASGVNDVKSSRDKEKKDMQDLNDRFANYLDKVRTLESQNRRLADELDKLKSRWGKETSQIKAMFQAELDDSRHQLDDAEKEKARLEIRVASLEDQLEELRVKLALAQQEVVFNRDKVNLQNQQLADYENEVQLLRKQLESLENEREKDKKKIAELQEALDRAREDLDIETLAHIDAENRRQTLEEEIEFLKSVHEQEMKELAALAYRDSSPETRDYWKNEMAQAIREIQQMYDDKMDLMRTDIETTYTSKLNDMRSNATRQSVEVNKNKEDCKDLRNTITDLRDKINKMDELNNQLLREIEALRRQKDEMERVLEADNARLRDEASQLKRQLDAIMQELQDVLNNKMTLELEISAYRKLLEGEENRIAVKQMNVSTTSSGDK